MVNDRYKGRVSRFEFYTFAELFIYSGRQGLDVNNSLAILDN